MDSSSTPRPPLPRNVRILGLASCLNDIASEMIYPLLPQFLIAVLHGNRFALGAIEGVADSVASLLKLWSGAWSDRLARRKGLIVFGYAIAAVLRPLIGVAQVPWHVFVARTGDRVGKGVRTSPRDALIADSTPAEYRGSAFGFHRAMDHLGAAIGPVLATVFLWIWPEQLRPLFLLTIVPGLAVVALLVVGLKETAPHEQQSQPFQLTLQPFAPSFKRYLGAIVLFTLGNASDAFLLVRAGELGVPTTLLPMLWFAFHVVKSTGNWLVGRLVDRLGPWWPLNVGWILHGVAFVGFGLARNSWQAWTVFLIYGVYYALSEPSEKTLVTQMAGPEHKGLAFGWYNFAVGVAALSASLAFGAIYDQFGPLAAFTWGAALDAAAVLLLWTTRKNESRAVSTRSS